MNSDSYKIIISLSHHRIAFEYWLRDGENKLVAMPNMSWPAPLAFYCSPTGIEIGDVAVRAVHSGTSNAFDNYFDRLTNDESYVYGGQRKPLRYILLDASESIFEDFFKSVLFGNKGSLSDNRATMPITLVCESDIKPNERALLLDLFKSSGYNRFKVVEYNTFIEQYLRSSIMPDYACNRVLVAWTEGADLTFTIFSRFTGEERRQVCFPRLGVDPRIEYVKGLIWDRIKGQNPWLSFSIEEETISKASADFLTSSAPMISDTLVLSDGVSYHYSLNRRVIDNLQCNEGSIIRTKLEDFLRESNILNRDNILLFLRGVAAGNIFFERTICQGFSKTIRSDRKLRNNTMQLLIEDANPVVAQEPENIVNAPQKGVPLVNNEENQVDKDNKHLVELKRKWREIKAQSSGIARDGRNIDAIKLLESFKVECSSISNTDNLIEEIENKISSFGIADATPTAEVNKSQLKKIEREWRELRATAKGKVRNQQKTEAINLLNSFLQKISLVQGSEALVKSVKAELSTIGVDEHNTQIRGRHQDGDIHPNGKWVWVSSAAGGKGDWRTIGGRIHQQAVNHTIGPEPSLDEGAKLVTSGKLKNARDWYRSKGDTHKARLLSDLIRAQKGVELRRTSLEEYKRTKNTDQIKRIITELQNYINQCDEVGYNCDDYRSLLSEYKKLIK
ncbi:MAG: hypothetical protein NC453_11090 [Muribaculum sp.]|nr:hypothetical protein [Muribaculum sp.]